MPLLLRVIRKNVLWDSEGGAVHPDTVGDFRTLDGKLSVWEIGDREENVARVVAAMTASIRKEHFDFLTFDSDIVAEVGGVLERSDGGTPDREANRTFHYDIVVGRIEQLVSLVENIFNKKSHVGRYDLIDISKFVEEAVDAARIPLTKVAPIYMEIIEGTPIFARDLKISLRKSEIADLEQRASASHSSWESELSKIIRGETDPIGS